MNITIFEKMRTQYLNKDIYANNNVLLTCLFLFILFPLFAQTSDKSVATNDYYSNYLSSSYDSDELNWTGSESNCDEGQISGTVRNKILQRINYFRRLVGLQDNVYFDPVKDSKCQKTALLMDANNSLQHVNIPTSWACRTSEGIEGAANSNLFGGNTGPNQSIFDYFDPIDSYIDDVGDHNISVGHRRFILHSKAQVFGVGQTKDYNALWVIGNESNQSVYNQFIAYPPAGLIPRKLVYDRWSFGIPNAGFLNANVTVKDQNNNSIAVNIISRTGLGESGAGDNSIVWEPNADQILTDKCKDVEYTVTVSNISNVTPSTYSYKTKIFHPEIGDSNADGRKNILDAAIIAGYVVGTRFVGSNCDNLGDKEVCLENIDVNCDGEVNILDAAITARCIVGLPTPYCSI